MNAPEQIQRSFTAAEFMRASSRPAPDNVAIGVDFFHKLGLIRVGQTGAAAFIANNLRVIYSSCRVVWMPVFCIGGRRNYY